MSHGTPSPIRRSQRITCPDPKSGHDPGPPRHGGHWRLGRRRGGRARHIGGQRYHCTLSVVGHLAVHQPDHHIAYDLELLRRILIGAGHQLVNDDHDNQSDPVYQDADHSLGPDMSVTLTKTATEAATEAGPGGAGPASEARPEGELATRSMRAIGTTAVVVVTAPDLADRALSILAADLALLDEACSRFRPDSELRRLQRASHGRPIEASPLLFEALEVACVIAVQTAGLVDPTIGSALVELGYDRDFDQLAGATMSAPHRPEPAPGWWQIRLDPTARTVSVPAGVQIDLGATAKAFAADRAVLRIAKELGCGVLVNLGGDVAVAGETATGGWPIGVAPECRTPLELVDQVVMIASGGLASSGTTARTWRRRNRQVHHIIDPWTGDAAPAVWSLVSATAASCVEANAWTTAAVVWGEDAVGHLAAAGVPARLVDAAGNVVHVGEWPSAGDRARRRSSDCEVAW